MYALIAAAGSGSRMREAHSNKSKILIELSKGFSALALSIKNFSDCESCKGIVVAVREEDEAEIRELFSSFAPKLDCHLVPGGADRQESVYLALKAVEGLTDYLAVHDAARPFCPAVKIEEVYQAARQSGAAILAVPATSTLKEIGEGDCIQRTIERSSIWEAQTPQVFQYEVLKTAHEKSLAEGYRGTDDAELVERLGKEVRIVEGVRGNIKLTTPDDLLYARFLLEQS